MISAMTTTLEVGETITIPQEMLDEAGLKPGTPVDVTVRAGHIEIEPASPDMRLEKRGRLTVLVPVEPVEGSLTVEQINELIEDIRDERMHDILGAMIARERIDRRD